MMAKDPGAPADVGSSYSDPLYDRLESVLHAVGRRWWALVAVILIAAGTTVVVKRMSQRSPEAASAHAYLQARDEGSQALIALIDDEAVLAEFRARAAIEAVAQLLAEDDVARAREVVDRAEPLARAAGQRELVLDVGLSRAAVLEQDGDREAALAAYGTALADSGGLPAHNITAALGSARTRLALAEQADDPDAAAELRREALVTLEAAAQIPNASDPQGIDLADLARFLREDLLRRHPELAEEAPEETPDAPAGTAPATPEKPVGDDQPVAATDGGQPADDQAPAADGAQQ